MLDLDQRRREFEAELLRKPARRRSNANKACDPASSPPGSDEFHATRFKERAWKGEEEETWRSTYKQSALEAAEWGKLTRLREQVVEGSTTNSSMPVIATADQPVVSSRRSNPNKQPSRTAVVDPLAVVKDAARVGAATRLPEKIVRNYVKSSDDDRTAEEYGAPTAAPYLHSSVDEVVLPAKPPPVIQKLRDANVGHRNEIVVRPMVELSRQVAFSAWQRQQRLQRSGARTHVRAGCSCTYCQTSSPFQTIAYQLRDRNPVPQVEHVEVLNVELPAQVVPAKEMDDDANDSDSYTEITVSTNDEQFYPVIECEPMDERRTSDITFEEASLLIRIHLTKQQEKEKAKQSCEPVKKDGACGSSANTTAQTSRTTKSSSQPVPVAKPSKKTVPSTKVVPRECDARVERRVDPVARSGPRAAVPKVRDTVATKPAAENRRRAPLVKRRERPNIQYVVLTKSSTAAAVEDVSTLSLPGYFEDKLERAILDQMYKPSTTTTVEAGARDAPSACRVTRFFQSHFGGHNK